MRTAAPPHVRRTTSLGDEAGFALILALFALVILTVLGVTAVTVSNVDLKIAHNVRRSRQVFFGAQAGLDRARIESSQMTEADMQTLMAGFSTGDYVQWLDVGEGDPVETGGYSLASYELRVGYRQCASNVAGYSVEEDGDFDAVFMDWVAEATHVDGVGNQVSPARARSGGYVRWVGRELCGGAMY
ncbi:pilus assembly PilX N-terminal domain-containing protein [Myxococcota bacterium]|nr:pilus assembly PilX N-terminal domain-containing protein [Myxococcota bacterium]